MPLRALKTFVDESIDVKSPEKTGKVIGPPRLEELGGIATWVADVDVGGGEELLRSCPISQYAQMLRHADDGTPVRLARNNAGLWQIVGRAHELVGNTNVATLDLQNEGLLFTYGLSLNTLGNPETQQGTLFTPPPTGNSVAGWIHTKLTFGELEPLGSKIFGAIKSVQVGGPNPEP